MTSVSNYLGSGVHGAFLFIDWLMFVIYTIVSIGLIVMLVTNPIAKIQNPLLFALHYVHIAFVIGILILLVYILFWNSSLAWMPPVLPWVQFLAMMTQEGIKARTQKDQPTNDEDESDLAENGRRSKSEDGARGLQLSGDLGVGEADLANRNVLKCGFRMLSLMFKAGRKSNPRSNPLATRRIADVLSRLDKIPDQRLAEPLYREALAATRQKWGGQHFRTAEALEKLADLIKRDGSPETESLYREAVAIRETVQGLDHVDTVVSANKLALYVSSQSGREWLCK